MPAASAGPVATRVGTFNLYQRSDNHRADAALRRFVEHVDLAGLQEYGGPARRASLADLRDLGFAFYKPRDVASAPPIIWDADRFQLMRGRSVLAADGRRVPAVPGKRAVLDDLFGTVVVLRDMLLDRETVVGNIHTPAHVELWPGPRRAMYREAVVAVVADMHLHRERPAYLAGDWNWSLRTPDALPRRLLARRGLVSCWSGNPSPVGTHGHRLIDGVFARDRADEAHVLSGFHVGDHDPAVATYTTKEHR
ncbi:endonuclease/exonuclease/phosphatase family protein [Nocardioides sp.]|uniref:endonuclease/exonuclease/phosphatase family protein n=1 Tax=Nocardioides sp. TaxID=35761 RepID=UPI00262A590E|nr:endonuclease/exonuclease/phosphatase family protein [Nocardioides sp.]MDI6911495.1 hypothetical protein [Nocardioides sp.]